MLALPRYGLWPKFCVSRANAMHCSTDDGDRSDLNSFHTTKLKSALGYGASLDVAALFADSNMVIGGPANE